MKKILIPILLFVLIFFTSCANEISQVSVSYIAEEGGTIEGEALQTSDFDGNPITFKSVKAVPKEGYKFIGWDDGLTTAVRQDTLSESKTCTAKFVEIPHIVATYEATEGGTIEGELVQKSLNTFATTKVKAIANEGYRFIGWDDGLSTITRQDIVEKNTTFIAKFEKINYVTVQYVATEGGKIVGTATQTAEDKLTTTEVEAVPDEGYGFYGWTDKNQNSVRSDTVVESKSFIAVFKKVHNVSFACESTKGEISGEINQTIFAGGQTTKVKASPKKGYKFLGWSNGEKGTELTISPKEDTEVFAIFVREEMLDLPLVIIDTELGQGITSKEEYISCVVSVDSTDYKHSFEGASARIRGRGNTSWDSPKKPYKLKFDEKVDLFGNGEAKTWTLIANYTDLSLIRNYLAYSVAYEFESLGSSSKTQFVELYLNDVYQGVYLVCEQVEVHENRVNVKDSYDIDTGYLIELDSRQDGAGFLLDDKFYAIKNPETDSTLFTFEHAEFIKNYLIECRDAINSGDYSKIEELIDTKSFAQAYLVFEIFNCVDVGYASFFMYKEAGGKLYCGPVWDFDRSLGIVGHQHLAEPYDVLWAKDSNPWFNKLLEHEEFYELVSSEFTSYLPKIEARLNACYDYVYSKQATFEHNFERWDILGTFVWPNSDEILAYDTWEGQVEYTREYLKNSINFLKGFYLKNE